MKIRGPILTLGAVAVLGVGILLVNMNDSAANTLRWAPSDRKADVRSGIVVSR